MRFAIIAPYLVVMTSQTSSIPSQGSTNIAPYPPVNVFTSSAIQHGKADDHIVGRLSDQPSTIEDSGVLSTPIRHGGQNESRHFRRPF